MIHYNLGHKSLIFLLPCQEERIASYIGFAQSFVPTRKGVPWVPRPDGVLSANSLPSFKNRLPFLGKSAHAFPPVLGHIGNGEAFALEGNR